LIAQSSDKGAQLIDELSQELKRGKLNCLFARALLPLAHNHGTMIEHHVLRLDWHDKNELNQAAAPLRDGSTYLSRIFAELCG
jgi:hypothetical protein